MRLSIITINYNNKTGLEHTIKSVVSQSDKDFEYIVVDGASTDGSADLLKQYGYCINVGISEPDTGIYNAMNKGIKRATGEYLLFLNSGDWLSTDTVIEKIYCQELRGDVIEGDTRCMRGEKQSHIWHAPEQVTANTFYSGSICHQSALIRRSLFDNCLYDESKKIASDMEFFFKKLIFEGATYQRIPVTISCFDVEGVSNNPKWEAIHEQEVNEIRKKLMPANMLPDYEEYILNRTYLEQWAHGNRQSFFVSFWSFWFCFWYKVNRKVNCIWR